MSGSIEKWLESASRDVTSDADGFLKAVQLYINKPHVVNRRICGAKEVADITTESIEETVKQLLVHFNGECDYLLSVLSDCIPENTHGEVQVIVQDLLPRQCEKHKTIRQLVIIGKVIVLKALKCHFVIRHCLI